MHDLVAVPSHPAVDDEADDPAASAFGLALRDLVPADERLVELARPGEPSLDRVGALVDLVAVERVARLETESVARTEADGQEAGLAAGFTERRPDRARTLARDEDFEPILARVAGPRDDRARPSEACPDDAEGVKPRHLGAALGAEDLRRARALDGDERGPGRTILERGVRAEELQNVRPVLRDVRGVHHHHELVDSDAIHDDVVHDRPALVAEKPVARLPHVEARDVARDQPIDGSLRAPAAEVELPHVRQVEEPGARTNGAVLGDDPRVLDWHLVAREGDHLRTEVPMLVVERRAP